METKLTIGIADMKMAKGSGMLVTYALGSCIGICLYDPLIKLAAMIHIMLPLNMEAGRQNTMKYADTGIRETLKQMEAKGASRARIVAKIAGGAKMFEVNGGSLGNIGQRNIDSVRFDMANYNAATNANITAGIQKVLDKMCADREAAMAARIQQLELAQAMCGVVRYPTGYTYNAGPSPFCGCNNGCGGNI